MILHLLHMRSNVNWNVFNDRENVSATALRVVTSPATISSPGMHDARGGCEDGTWGKCYILCLLVLPFIIIITQVLLATQLSWIDITIGYN